MLIREHGLKTQVALVPFVQAERCQRCANCAARKSCRTKALVRLDPEEAPWVDAGRCYGCGDCILSCPHGAISLAKKDQQEGRG